ncbi:MAG TPA: NAD(P)-dependent oxidoreductase [Sphingomonas sp.]|nr:NAD(P)-dependent oxidoreductase [Sphingomonas sp.]
MKILVVGGTGMIGGHAALHLKMKGHEVAIAGRNRPAAGTPLGDLLFLRVDYVAMDYDRAALAGFDAMVFAAGNDIRHVPEGADDAHWEAVNTVAVPRFLEAAKAAGIGLAVNVGSFYPQAAPELIETNAYIRSRKGADDGVAALADAGFRAMSVNAPFVLGSVPGLVVPMFAAYVAFAEGKLASIPEFVPPGGTNFISTRSLSEAIEGGLERGKAGASYLVGDENLSFQDYFGGFFEAVGRKKPPVRDEEHPMLPDSALFFGRGNTLYYEPDVATAALLGYRRNDVMPAIREIVAQYRSG